MMAQPAVSPEQAAQAAERRLRSDGADDLALGLLWLVFALVAWIDSTWPAYFPVLATAGYPFLRARLRERISDARLGYVKPLEDSNNPYTKPIPRGELPYLAAFVILFLLVCTPVGIFALWWTTGIDLEPLMQRTWRLTDTAFSSIVEVITLGLVILAYGVLRAYAYAALALATVTVALLLLNGDGATRLLLLAGILGCVHLAAGGIAAWRVYRLPIVVEPEP